MPRVTRRRLALIAILMLSSSVAGCAGKPAHRDEGGLLMPPMAQMPADIQSASAAVQQAYRFAAANPGLLTQVPCYCGCGAMGHTSNYSCYVAGVDADGKVAFDRHALGCSICVDITQDVMRLRTQGKQMREIRAFIDNTYSRYGSSNMP